MPRASSSQLTARQELFIQEYLVDLKARDAAIRAGYAASSAHVAASRILATSKAKEAISAALADRFGVTKLSIVDELSAIAFANLGDHYAWNEGRIRARPSRSLTKAQQHAVASIRRVQSPTGSILEVRLPDKLRALELLSRVLGLIDRPDAQSSNG